MWKDGLNACYPFSGEAGGPVCHFVSTSFIFSKNRRAFAPSAPNFSSTSRTVFQPAETSLHTSLFTSLSTARRIGTSSATSLTTLIRFTSIDALDIWLRGYKFLFRSSKEFPRPRTKPKERPSLPLHAIGGTSIRKRFLRSGSL